MAAQRPVYVFVGGVSHTPAFFSLLISELQKLEYEAVAVSYPTVGEPSDTEGTTQPDEVEAIQAAVANIVEGRKRDVVLVLHSYGGWPGSRAVKGWDRETRKSLGKESGIVEVVFLAAFLLPDNADMATYSHLPDWLTVEVNDLGISASNTFFLTRSSTSLANILAPLHRIPPMFSKKSRLLCAKPHNHNHGCCRQRHEQAQQRDWPHASQTAAGSHFSENAQTLIQAFRTVFASSTKIAFPCSSRTSIQKPNRNGSPNSARSVTTSRRRRCPTRHGTSLFQRRTS